MDYGEILSRAWKITWSNKILWLFGFLAGVGPSFNFRDGGSSGSRGGAGGGNLPPNIERQLERPEVVAIVLAVGCVILLLAVALFILSIIARGGLVGGIRLADDNGKVTFSEAWSIGLRYFWRTLGMTIVLVAPAILFGGVAAGVVFLTLGLGALCLLPLICVFAILYIPFSIVVWLGQIGIVVDDLNVFAAVGKGWEILKANVGPVIILGLILFVIGILIGFLVLVPLVFVAAPIFLALVVNPERPNVPLLVGAGLALLCLLPVLWVFGSIVNTWTYSVWTLAYRRFTGLKPAAAPGAMQPV